MKKTTIILGAFSLFWAAATVALDVSITRNLIHQLQTNSYARTTGTVLHAEVDVASDSDGTTYTPRIRYRYQVAGHSYEATRIRFSLFTFGSADAHALIREHQPGSSPTVFYDLNHPDRAVLQRGIEGSDILPLVFSLPFNAILGLGLLMILDKPLARRRTGDKIGGVRVWQEGGVTRARVRSESAAWAAGLGFTGAIGFVEFFALAFTPLRHSMSVVVIACLGAVLTGIITTIRMRTAIGRGRWDMLIDEVGRHITIPGGQAVPFDAVVGAKDVPGRSGEDGPTSWTVALEHQTGTDRLANASTETDAKAFAAWLNQKMRPRSHAAAA